MDIITDDMRRIVDEQRLGFIATVDEDGSPNLSPKGTTRVWDDEHLFFADICSPRTTANIRRGSLVEINVVDPFIRKGYRFKGRAEVHERGTDVYKAGLARLRAQGSTLTSDRVDAIVLVAVARAEALISPAYDDASLTEVDVLHTYELRYADLHTRFRDDHPRSD